MGLVIIAAKLVFGRGPRSLQAHVPGTARPNVSRFERRRLATRLEIFRERHLPTGSVNQEVQFLTTPTSLLRRYYRIVIMVV